MHASVTGAFAGVPDDVAAVRVSRVVFRLPRAGHLDAYFIAARDGEAAEHAEPRISYFLAPASAVREVDDVGPLGMRATASNGFILDAIVDGGGVGRCRGSCPPSCICDAGMAGRLLAAVYAGLARAAVGAAVAHIHADGAGAVIGGRRGGTGELGGGSGSPASTGGATLAPEAPTLHVPLHPDLQLMDEPRRVSIPPLDGRSPTATGSTNGTMSCSGCGSICGGSSTVPASSTSTLRVDDPMSSRCVRNDVPEEAPRVKWLFGAAVGADRRFEQVRGRARARRSEPVPRVRRGVRSSHL